MQIIIPPQQYAAGEYIFDAPRLSKRSWRVAHVEFEKDASWPDRLDVIEVYLEGSTDNWATSYPILSALIGGDFMARQDGGGELLQRYITAARPVEIDGNIRARFVVNATITTPVIVRVE